MIALSYKLVETDTAYAMILQYFQQTNVSLMKYRHVYLSCYRQNIMFAFYYLFIPRLINDP